MRISDWRSDVCSSDLHGIPHPAAPSSGTAQMSPGKILVVDDDAAIRTVVSEALKQAGHEVRAVPDLASMRLALAEGYGEVLVTDVMLPDGNGLDVVPEIISSYPNLPRSEEHTSELQSLMRHSYAVFCLQKK